MEREDIYSMQVMWRGKQQGRPKGRGILRVMPYPKFRQATDEDSKKAQGLLERVSAQNEPASMVLSNSVTYS